jgi:exopolysaccharide biosynthesis polyprenyl glycosylphosphotransferase
MFSPKGLVQRWTVLIAGDVLATSSAAFASFAAVGGVTLGVPVARGVYGMTLGLTLVYIALIYFADLYLIEQPRSRAWIAASVLTVGAGVATLSVMFRFIAPQYSPGLMFYSVYIPTSVLVVTLWHLSANQIFFSSGTTVMALGIGECTPVLAEEVNRRSHLGYRFVGSIAVGDQVRMAALSGSDVYPLDSFDEVAPRANTLVLCSQSDLPDIRSVVQCRVRGIKVLDFVSFYELITGKLPVRFLQESWFLFAPGFAGSSWGGLLKRTVDLIASALLTFVASPFALLTAIAIKLDSPGPVLYSQDRVGLDGKVFKLYKFRSMCDGAENGTGAVWAAQNDPRVTRVGRIIRKLRIDELPQLFNIVRGDMSLVGPRPERVELVTQLSGSVPFYDYRHLVRPGLTGWAQVCNGYGATPEESYEKLCYDLYYIKNWSLILDLQIILQTVKVVLLGRGAR